MKKKRIPIVIAIVVLILLVGIVAAGTFVFRSYYAKSNYVGDNDVVMVEDTSEDGSTALDSTEEETLREATQTNIEPLSGKDMEGIYNLLLIGSDRREDNWYGNSDVMVLITLNSHTKKLYMTSFMRDLYADIPGVGVRKLNNAYARGGGPLLVETLESNYGVSIDNYASVDFGSMSNVIDILGGVDIQVDEDEVDLLNSYSNNICQIEGKNFEDYRVTSGGMLHLNGIQAVAYQRIRYVGNADFERTSRQRRVLQAIFAQAQSLSVGEITQLLDEILPLITHNMDQITMLKLMTQISTVLHYNVVENRIPYDNMYSISHEILIPEMAETIEKLRSTIYATE